MAADPLHRYSNSSLGLYKNISALEGFMFKVLNAAMSFVLPWLPTSYIIGVRQGGMGVIGIKMR